MSAIPRSSNKAIHDALRVLAREIQSGDGAANVAIAEGADRISELGNEVEQLERENAALRSLLREAITDHVSPYDVPGGAGYIARVKTALGEGKP
jgi:hypothetical protein